MPNDVALRPIAAIVAAAGRVVRAGRIRWQHRRAPSEAHEGGSIHFHRAALVIGLLSTCAVTMLFRHWHRLSVFLLPAVLLTSSSGGKLGGSDAASGSLWRFYQQKAAMQSQGTNATAAEMFAINVVLTSDVHGRVRGTCIAEQDQNKTNRPTTACYPGAAHLSTVISTVRTAVAAETNEFAVLVDAGDAFFGDPNTNETNVAAVMNKLGYDAMALGNHEWDFGPDRLRDFARSIDFPILAGNLESSEETEEENDDTNATTSTAPMKSYVKINLSSNITLCLLGITAKEENPFAGPDVKISDEMDSVRRIVEELSRSSACSCTVLLSHAGFEVDRKIAREVRLLGLKLDAIVGGHSHVVLGMPDETDRLQQEFGVVKPGTKFPLRDSLSNANGYNSAVPVAHVGSAGYFVGLLRLMYIGDGGGDSSVQVDGELLPLDETHGVQPDMSFHQWQENKFPPIVRAGESIADSASSIHVDIRTNAGASSGRPISTAICGQSCRTGECLLGNLISDSMKSCLDNGPCATALLPLPVRPVGNFAFLESGTIRACTSSPFDDFSEILPWPNKLVILAMKGDVIRKVLNHGLNSMVNAQGGGFLQTSGLEYTYLNSSVDDIFLSTVSKFRKASKRHAKTDGTPHSVIFEVEEQTVDNTASCQVSSSVASSRILISDHSLYFVIVTDWLASGGDGYKDLVAMAEHHVESNVTLSEAILMYTSSSPSPIVRIEGRFKQSSDSRRSSALREGISAFLGGGVAFLLSYPMYTLFVRRSMAKSIKCSVRRLFDGCCLGFFASAISDSLYFMVYNLELLTSSSSFLRSSVASICNSLATTPLWVIVTHKQLQEKETSVIQIARAIYRERSVCGFFDSISMNLLMCIFPVVRQLTLELTLRIFSIEEQNQIALAASLSSIVATIVTYPIQKARVLLQSGEESPNVSSIWHYLYDGVTFKVLDTMTKTFLLFLIKEHSASILCVLEV
mmetsp:Transcript_9215/g.25911  ORF Transcript_9215/g.25911 Transcript_9215/m.25911 type:complete len:971 (+) Transcript_9215:172-3084(+)